MSEITATPHVATPTGVVIAFLDAMAAGDVEASVALLDEDILYTNVGLRPMRGKAAVAKFLGALDRPGAGFEVVNHHVMADGPVVLTERTDVILLRGVRLQFWVWGRFEVEDGKITVWRDSFDFLDMAKATVRGVIGRFVPARNPVLPAPSDDPGR